MALVKINGMEFPELVTYKVDIEPVGEWERNANALLVGDLIAIKTKLNLAWGIMVGNNYQLLLSSVQPFFLRVEYWDPRQNRMTSGEFYASPQSGSLSLIDSHGVYWWKEVAFNLIER